MADEIVPRADLYGALSALEGQLKPFLASIDEPVAPMDAVIDAASQLADQAASGAPVRGGEIGQIMSLTSAVSVAFDKVWKLFQSARDAGYAVAAMVGAPTKGKPKTKKPPTDYSGVPDQDIVKGISDLAPKFKSMLSNVRDLGQRLYDQVGAALNDIDSDKSDGVDAARALIPAFVEFRDSLSAYYAIMGSLSRRVNQLLVNVGHSKTDDAGQDKPVSEMILIPWEDEFGEYEGDSMMEGKKPAAKKVKTEDEKPPVGAAGNLPEPSSAPPIGVEKKVALPPMMQVERLVRSLKNQVLEGLK